MSIGTQKRIDADLADINKGHILTCHGCGRTQEIDQRYWREGWPKCCGATMNMTRERGQT